MTDKQDTEFLEGLFDQAQSYLKEGENTLSTQIRSLNEYYSEPVFFAQGGMKLIYKVRDLKSDRTVAMAKLPTDADSAQIENFFREARLTAKLQHPNIIPIHDIGYIDGEAYFTMKFLEGNTLEEVITGLINENPLMNKKYSSPELLRIFQNVCNAVAFAHSKGVIHLDLKPANIHVSNYGEVTLCDWGLAKVIDEEVSDESFDNYSLDFLDLKNQTLNGYVKGTPGYLAPEQIKAISPKDKRTDIYALGAILYNILTLRKVIEEKDSETYKQKLFSGEVKDPISLVPSIPQGLNAITTKCISIKPEERYQNINALLDDMKAYSGGFATEAENADMITLFKKLIARNRAVFGLSFLFLVILGGTLAFYFSQLDSEKKAKIRNYEKMISEEKLRLELSKDSAEQHKTEAQRLYDEGKLESALLNLETAINLNPSKYIEDELFRKCLLASGNFKRLESLKLKDSLTKWISSQSKYDNSFFQLFYNRLKEQGDEKLYRLAQKYAHKKYFTAVSDQRELLNILLRIDNPKLDILNLTYNGKVLYLGNNINLLDVQAVNAVYFTDLDLSGSTVENIDKVNYKKLNSLNLSYSKVKQLPNWTDANLTYLDLSYCLINELKNINNFTIGTLNCRGIYIPLTDVFKNDKIQKIMVSNDVTLPYSESSNQTFSSKLLKYEEFPKTSIQGIRYAQFVIMDHNRDLVLSKYEFQLSPKLFASWDFNNDGFIQSDEFMRSPRPIPDTAKSEINFIKTGNIECMDSEVTNAQFCDFLNEYKQFFHDSKGVYLNGKLVYYYFPSTAEYESKISFKDKKFEVKGGFENYPVNFVTFYGASAFAKFHKGRLMKLSDWQMLKSINDSKYLTYTGQAKENTANFYSYLFHLRTHMPLPVKFYRPAKSGLFDLMGNLREWSSEVSGSGTSENAKVYGGSFLTVQEWSLPAKSQSLNTQYCDSQTGFRIVKDIKN